MIRIEQQNVPLFQLNGQEVTVFRQVSPDEMNRILYDALSFVAQRGVSSDEVAKINAEIKNGNGVERKVKLEEVPVPILMFPDDNQKLNEYRLKMIGAEKEVLIDYHQHGGETTVFMRRGPRLTPRNAA